MKRIGDAQPMHRFVVGTGKARYTHGMSPSVQKPD